MDEHSKVLSKIDQSFEDLQNLTDNNKSELLFDFNPQIPQTRVKSRNSQNKNFDSLGKIDTQRIKMFNTIKSARDKNGYQSTAMLEVLKNFNNRNMEINKQIVDNPPFLYKRKIVKVIRNQSLKMQFRTTDNEKDVDKNDTNKNECFEMIRNFNKMASGKLGKD